MPSLLDPSPGGAPELPPQESKSILRSILPYTTAAVLIAAIYAGWTFWSRHQAAQDAQQAAEQKQQQAAKDSYAQITQHGELSFVTFEAADGTLKRGASTELCYGVVNATSVKLDPPVEETLQPTMRHCIEISPKRTTTYTMTAADGSGQTKTVSLTVRVQ